MGNDAACGDSGSLSDGDMARSAYLAGKSDLVFEGGASGDSDLGNDKTVAPDADIVREMNEVVDFGSIADNGLAHGGAVDRDVCTDFNIIADFNDSDLGDFFVSAIGGMKAEAVASEDGA